MTLKIARIAGLSVAMVMAAGTARAAVSDVLGSVANPFGNFFYYVNNTTDFGTASSFWTLVTTSIASSQFTVSDLSTYFGSLASVNISNFGASNPWSMTLNINALAGTLSYGSSTFAEVRAPSDNPFSNGSGSFAVPGPVAGAGLPAVLGLMGFGLWRRRVASAA